MCARQGKHQICWLPCRYFPYAYGVGARVHSDSWGRSATTYDFMASQVDLFTWTNQVQPISCSTHQAAALTFEAMLTTQA